MDFDITTVRKLTTLRNKMDEGDPLRQRLSNILLTAENINKAEPGPYRDELELSFRRQWAEYVEAGGTAG